MATATSTTSTEASSAPAATTDILARVRGQAGFQGSRSDYFRQALHTVANYYQALYGSVDVRSGATSLSHEYRCEELSVELLQSLVDAMLLEAQSEDRGTARTYNSVAGGRAVVVLATPMHGLERGEIIGGMAIAVVAESDRETELLLAELTSLMALIMAYQPRDESRTTSTSRPDQLRKVLERAARYGSVRELAFSLVNSVCTKFDCAQVSLGIVKGPAIQLMAISGMDRFSPRSPGVSRIGQAMEECLDSGSLIVVQEAGDYGDDRGATGYRLHRDRHQHCDQTALLSIPLSLEDETIAVVSLQREARKPFSKQEIERLRATLDPFAPAIAMLPRSNRRMHAQSDSRRLAGMFATGLRRVALLCSVTAFGAWFVMGSLDYKVTVPCNIAPAEVRHVVSPFDAAVAESFVEMGDRVAAGQLLLTLDTREWELEQERLLREIAAQKIAVDRAVAQRNVTEATVGQADVEVLRVQLELVRQKLALAEIRAPAAGIVLQGEVTRNIGQTIPKGTPIVEIGSDEGRFVELKVPENVALHFQQGNAGQFAPTARPGTALDCRIRRITPAAKVVDGKNVFLAEAVISDPPPWMRVGMEGSARIHVGQRKVWWIVLHRWIDRIRLLLWV